MLLIGTAGVGAVLGLVAFLVGFKTVGLYLFVGMGSIVLVLIVVAGYFTYPEVSVVERTPTFPLVYKPYTGPISQVALYYDSPGEVPDDKLRWCVGVVEEDIGQSGLGWVNFSRYDGSSIVTKGWKQLMHEIGRAGCKCKGSPIQSGGRKAVGTQWSFRPFLGILSIYFMVNRAYPEMERFCKKMK
eukprot:1355746-Amorphochlora_amoeboformis.AAC.2